MGKDTSKIKDNSAKNTDGLKPWKPGESGNPNGRPRGRKNFSTLFQEAIEKIALATGQEPEAFELEIIEQAIRKARNGDYRFYRDTMDRLHGQAAAKMDLTSNGKDLPTPIIKLNVSGDNSSTEDSSTG